MNILTFTATTEARPVLRETSSKHTGATRGRVLLVEDDPAVRRYLEVVLQRAGFGVTTAADGLEAMKQTLAESFDAVVTDAILPFVSGGELCRYLRRHPRLKDIPVILLSGLGSHALGTQADEADVHLAKPVRPETLTNCLTRLLAQAA